ncbi:MAG TPA: beta-ketoacyl synthase N-terminal-like domain-containing protein, partial [Myxococcaceae bacterium]|nr:beta-ketoacyl synthase N-terminal-like domain-containing protein [Myxococcaceae bacterium]
YTCVAAGLALKDAALQQGRVPGTRIGVVVGLTRGPLEAQGRFFADARRSGIEQVSPKHFAGSVVSTIAGQVAQSLQLRGLSSTVVDGPTSGLHALVHACELLRDDDTVDALVVVAADELGRRVQDLYERRGWLADADAEALRPYDPEANGLMLGEGAVAVVLERSSSARARGARVRARLPGCGQTADGRGFLRMEPEGRGLERAMRLALEEAGLEAGAVDVAYGHGRGVPGYDGREALAFQRLLGDRPVPFSCVMGHTGVAEAACGLYSVAAAVLGLRAGEAYPLASTGALPTALRFVQGEPVRGVFRQALVAGSTDSGNNAAVLLTLSEAG